MQVRRLRENAILPKYQTSGAAGMDMHACIDETITIKPGEIITIPSGLSFKIPEGCAGIISSRSGLAKNGITIPNGIAIIDSDYRGEVLISLVNLSSNDFVINPGDRICQMTIFTTPQYQLEDMTDKYNSGELNDSNWIDTVRGIGGHGSTGKN